MVAICATCKGSSTRVCRAAILPVPVMREFVTVRRSKGDVMTRILMFIPVCLNGAYEVDRARSNAMHS